MADDGIDFLIAYTPKPAESLKEKFSDRPVQPGEEWRFWWELHDSSGEQIWLMPTQFFEFHSFEELGMEGTSDRGQNPVLRWVSPEKPPMTAKVGETILRSR